MGYSDNLSQLPTSYLLNEISRHEQEIANHIREMKMVREALAEKEIQLQSKTMDIASRLESWELDPDRYSGDLAGLAHEARSILTYIREGRDPI